MLHEEIPAEYQVRWNELELELHTASVEVNESNKHYHDVILARIALREEMIKAGSPEFNLVA